MIKFFRKIRYEFIKRKNTTNYLKYAGGEIILVVIGILIALQINNLNENRKDRMREQVVLKQLLEDYKTDRSQLEQKMLSRKRIINSAFYILEAIDNQTSIISDSLIIHIAEICNDPTFDPIQTDLVGSDNLRLISNTRLKRLLSNWTSDVVAVKEVEDIYSNQVHNHLNPKFRELGISRDIVNSFWKDQDQIWLLDHEVNPKISDIGTSKFSVSNEFLTKSKDIEGFASSSISLNTAANLQSQTLLERIDEIINLLEKEIIED